MTQDETRTSFGKSHIWIGGLISRDGPPVVRTSCSKHLGTEPTDGPHFGIQHQDSNHTSREGWTWPEVRPYNNGLCISSDIERLRSGSESLDVFDCKLLSIVVEQNQQSLNEHSPSKSNIVADAVASGLIAEGARCGGLRAQQTSVIWLLFPVLLEGYCAGYPTSGTRSWACCRM